MQNNKPTTIDEINRRDNEEQEKRRLAIKTMENPIKENKEWEERHTKEFRENLYLIMSHGKNKTNT